jgi:hypothetical protein
MRGKPPWAQGCCTVGEPEEALGWTLETLAGRSRARALQEELLRRAVHLEREARRIASVQEGPNGGTHTAGCPPGEGPPSPACIRPAPICQCTFAAGCLYPPENGSPFCAFCADQAECGCPCRGCDEDPDNGWDSCQGMRHKIVLKDPNGRRCSQHPRWAEHRGRCRTTELRVIFLDNR